jgi:hypothetical protein
MAAVPLVRLVARLTHFLSTAIVHPSVFPYPLTPTLHAARISIAFRANARRTGSRLSRRADLAGFLLMARGFLITILLFLPSPLLQC